MSNIKFVSHHEFPEDQYTKELVYLCIDDKFRVAYVRKQSKSGGMFWSVPSISVTQDGTKAYFESFLQDSVFLDKDIQNFLDKKLWQTTDNKGKIPSLPSVNEEEIPF